MQITFALRFPLYIKIGTHNFNATKAIHQVRFLSRENRPAFDVIFYP